jgi:hypothetical protein
VSVIMVCPGDMADSHEGWQPAALLYPTTAAGVRRSGTQVNKGRLAVCAGVRDVGKYGPVWCWSLPHMHC